MLSLLLWNVAQSQGVGSKHEIWNNKMQFVKADRNSIPKVKLSYIIAIITLF